MTILRARALALLFGAALPLAAATPATAILVITAEQVGSDVLLHGSGSANLQELTSDGTTTRWTNVLTASQFTVGPAAFDDGSVGLWRGLSGPTAFGSLDDLVENPGTGEGDLFGLLATSSSGAAQLVLPLGYSSGSPLSGSSTFASRTLAELGLTPGQVSRWSWGSGDTADLLELRVGFSDNTVPAPLPMAGAAAAFGRVRRLRRLRRQGRA